MLTLEEKRLIDEAASAMYYVHKDEQGMNFIDLYADYMDTNEGLLQLAYDHRSDTAEQRSPENGAELYTVLDLLQKKISEGYENTTRQMEDDILRRAGFDPAEEKAQLLREYIWDAYSFRVPYDHYLSQNMHINLMLGTPEELNRDFGAIRETHEALTGQLEPEAIESTLQENTALRWLVEQQGYTMQELHQTMQDYIQCFFGNSDNAGMSHEALLSEFHKTHSFFLSSVCEELDNVTNYMNTVTILADISMWDYCALLQPGKELVLPKDTILGIFSPWLGGGSALDISLEKDLVLPSAMIWDIQVEGADLQSQYSVDSVYGLTGRAWKQPLSIRDAVLPQKDKPMLDAAIKAADDRRTNLDVGKEKPIPEPEL